MSIEEYLINHNFTYPLNTLEDNAVKHIATNYNLVADKCRISRKRALRRLREVLLVISNGCMEVQSPIYKAALECIEMEIGK